MLSMNVSFCARLVHHNLGRVFYNLAVVHNARRPAAFISQTVRSDNCQSLSAFSTSCVTNKTEAVDTTVKSNEVINTGADEDIGDSGGGESFTDTGMPDKLYRSIHLEMRGYEGVIVENYDKFITMAAKEFGITIGERFVPSRPDFDRLTLLKSVHVHKKHRVQYEVRTYHRMLELVKLTGSTADTFLEYIERALPEGVAMKVQRTEIQPIPRHLTLENVAEANEIDRLQRERAEREVAEEEERWKEEQTTMVEQKDSAKRQDSTTV